MYEHLRNDFAVELSGEYSKKDVNKVLTILDKLMNDYDISEKATDLAVIENQIPHELKVFLASKRLEGLSDASIRIYSLRLRQFYETVGKPTEAVTTNDVRLFLASYKSVRKVSDRSLDKFRQIINGYFTWLCDEEYITKNPCRTIKAFKYEAEPRQALSRYQLERLRRLCKTPRELAIVDVLYSTGCRVSELCNMKLSDIDFENHSVHIVGKGKKHNTVYLNSNAIISLADYLNSRKGNDDYVFLSVYKPYGRITPHNVERIMKELSKDLGCKLTPHIMRHTMATLSLEAGMPINQVQKILNHSSVNTTQIYAKTSAADVKESHRRYVV